MAEAGPGVLMGIARHARSRAPIEALGQATVTLDGGIVGDFRGGMRGRPYKRQVTLMERIDWDAAMAELGVDLPWTARRCNLLVDGIDVPQQRGARLRIGADVVLEVAGEDDPCARMEEVAAGLRAALVPDWRGGALSIVISPGIIAVGDLIRIDP